MQEHCADQEKKRSNLKRSHREWYHLGTDITYITSRNIKIMEIGNKLVALGDRNGIDYKGVTWQRASCWRLVLYLSHAVGSRNVHTL